ncbi:CYFA0S24e01662g1_1 [Cyberlindnera fabianii]|uniref:Protein ROT1 n=1 Tax=Cyberlindnera fabianii TaxID=36022 RepID=A0A061BFH5_CYBFA|nr:Protein ROT1 [Cyberlindnera fabianii]CDR46636.1 CYFA0S24e01662g1_1 [Cyberlindnera fabianii]
MQLSSLLATLALSVASLADDTNAGNTSQLVGTWSSKSNTVFTGPSFYDPVDELLIEPALPGISYSFTEDGYWEEAIYQVTANPKNHSCPTAALIFQHGTYEVLDNLTIILTPIEVDGRQLLSDPCNDGGVSTYSKYNQTEMFLEWRMSVNAYHGRYMLELFQWDGTPVQPLYLAYQPPMMLPTETMNPTASADHSEATNTASLKRKVRRSLENQDRTRAVRKSRQNFDLWWWVSIGFIGVGSTAYFLI